MTKHFVNENTQFQFENTLYPLYRDEWQTGKVTTNNQATKEHFHFNIPWQYLAQIKFTVFIMLLCIVIYLFEIIGFAQPIMAFSHYPEPYQTGELWRYVTHSLVHLSLPHIAFNLTWWWLFGAEIERQCGSFKLGIIYFMGAILSGMAQNYASGPAFFGLSGVVYAVLGYVLVLDKLSLNHRFNLPSGFFGMLIIGIGLGFFTPLIGFNTGNTAHISGFIVGIILGFLDGKKAQRSR